MYKLTSRGKPMKIKSINPYTEEVNWIYDSLSFGECEIQIENARLGFSKWSLMPVEERAEHFAKVGEILKQNKEIYARIITKEIGKPIRYSRDEIDKCALLCDYYSKNAIDFLKDEIVDSEFERSYVTFEPLGILLGMMPWNMPFWHVFKFAVPAICAGNVCLVKPASNVPRSGLEIEEIFLKAGFPEGVFKTLLIDLKTAMEILEEDLVDGAAFTGNVSAGSEIGELAGGTIKPFVLELGGSDPFIVLEDADLGRAVQAAVKSRFLNSGQNYTAAKRFIVLEDIVVDFIEMLELSIQELKIGDPMEEDTDIGPLAKKEFVDILDKALKDVRKKGAEPHIYGEEPEKGFFFRPALIPAASTDMKICNTEIFGPVAPIITAKNEDEAIEIANSTDFGLGAEIWSENLERAEKLAKKIKSGFVAINEIVTPNPKFPFGGTKKSGLGRQLSHYGLKEFVNIKTIIINR